MNNCGGGIVSQKMYMTDEEIASSYRQAKNKNTQVRVLADLNVVSREKMAQKLRDLGLMDDPPARKRGRRRKEIQLIKQEQKTEPAAPAEVREPEGTVGAETPEAESEHKAPVEVDVKVAESAADMSLRQLAELLGDLSQIQPDGLVYVGEKAIRAVVVTLRYGAGEDLPELQARLETD